MVSQMLIPLVFLLVSTAAKVEHYHHGRGQGDSADVKVKQSNRQSTYDVSVVHGYDSHGLPIQGSSYQHVSIDTPPHHDHYEHRGEPEYYGFDYETPYAYSYGFNTYRPIFVRYDQ